MTCREYRISGIVQGVGFRWSTKNKADELKILGTARNNPDGSVTIFVCGDDWQLEQFDNWLRGGGPRFSDIENIERSDVELDNIPTTFEII